MTHFAFVHLEFGDRRRDGSLDLLAKLRNATLKPGDRHSIVIVDNARMQGAERCAMHGFDAEVIAGDNSNREFTGWDRGIAQLRASQGEPDIWLFSNDTAAHHHGWSAARAAHFADEINYLRGHQGSWMLGELVDLPQPMVTPAGPAVQFLSTYLFAMSRVLREGLGELSPPAQQLDALVLNHFEPGAGVFAPTVDAQYVDFVSAWLIGSSGGSESGSDGKKFGWSHEWHNRSALDEKSFADLRMKARCVLSESMLSVRARKLGADLRSPYDAQNLRARLRKLKYFVQDKLAERKIMKEMARRSARG